MKYDEFKKFRAPVVSANVGHYNRAKLRHNGLLLDHGPEHPETIRVSAAVAAVAQQLTSEEHAEYQKVFVPRALTVEEKAAEREALVKAMEANKDSPSI